MGTKEEGSFAGVFAMEAARYLRPPEWRKLIAKSDLSLCKKTENNPEWPGRLDRRSFGKDLAKDENFFNMFYENTGRTLEAEVEEATLVEKIVATAKRVHVGMSAIAHAYALLRSGVIIQRHTRIPFRAFTSFARKCLALQSMASKLHPDAVEKVRKRFPDKVEKVIEDHWRISDTTLQLWTWGKAQSTKMSYQEAQKEATLKEMSMMDEEYGHFASEDDEVLAFRVGTSLLILDYRNDSKSPDLTWVDGQNARKLIQLTKSVLASLTYAAAYNLGARDGESEIWEPTVKTIAMIIESFEDANSVWVNRVCQGYKKLWDIYLSMLAGHLSDLATRELINEWKKDGYSGVAANFEFIKQLTNLRPRLAVEIGRMFKILPAPCYDVAECWYDALEKMNTPNVAPGLDAKADMAEPNLRGARCMMLHMWLSARKDHLKSALGAGSEVRGLGKLKLEEGKRPPKWWHKYKDNFQIPSSFDKLELIDITGDQTYLFTAPDDLSAFKSKSTTEDTVKEAIGEENPQFLRRNLITRAVKDTSMPSPAGQLPGVGGREHPHRVGFKNEIHKPYSRLFFQASPADRFALSEFEHNVGRICKIVPGFEVGADPADQIQRLVKQITPPISPTRTNTMYYFNFDISKWSPKMRAEWQDAIYDFFAMLFALPEIVNLRKIHTEAVVILNKLGYVDTWRNYHANFDGYDGKAMTFGQCTMIYYATFLAQRKTWGRKIGPIRFLAYIDDGACSLELPSDDGDMIFAQFCHLVEKVYTNLGFDLSAYKCSISTRLQVFLNEIYLVGMPIKYGMRAALQLGVKTKDRHFGIIAELQKHAGTSRGVAKAGAGPLLTGFLYYTYASMTFWSWDPGFNIRSPFVAIATMAPISRGGYGLFTLNTLGSNLGAQPLSEGVALLLSIARHYAQFRPFVCRILRRSVSHKTATQALLSPRMITDVGHALSATRLRNAIAKKLQEAAVTPLLKGIMTQMAPAVMREVAENALPEGAVVSARILDAIVKTTPMWFAQQLARKFDTSSVLIAFLGRRALQEIADRNGRDVMARNKDIVHSVGMATSGIT